MNAKTYLQEGITCVIVKNDQIYQAKTSGIRPLLEWLDEMPCPLTDGDIADRVVGKAAALLFRYANIHSLYTEVISEHALQALQNSDIEVSYDKLVPHVKNRDQTGMCPMEAKVLDIDDPILAYQILSGK